MRKQRNNTFRPRRVGASLVAGALFGAALISVAPAVVATSASAEESLPAGAPDVARVQTDFDHPISLLDAATITEVGGDPVVAYRFQSGDLVGEFARPGTADVEGGTLSPDAFVQQFEGQYGTQPQVIGVITQRPIEEVLGTGDARRSAPLQTTFPEYIAPLASAGESVDMVVANEANQPDRSGAENARAGSSWKPNQAQIDINVIDINTVQVMGYYYWGSLNPYNSPDLLSADFGLEFQVDVYTDNPAYQTGDRPGQCPSDYKSRPSIQNQNYSWSAYMSSPQGGLAPVTAMQSAYADYNDALDPCYRSSIAIGLGNPQSLPKDNMTYSHVQTVIWAPRGIEAKSRISGVVQAVDRLWCAANPLMTPTDCMGVLQTTYPGGAAQGNRYTLGVDRAWIAPDKCWFSDDFGNTAPQSYC